MPGCCAFPCASRRENGFMLFTIPRGKNDISRRKKWIHNIGRKDFTPTNHTVLCELHFDTDQIEQLILQKYGKKKLKPNAIPTIFSHRSAPKQRKPPAIRLPLPNKSACVPANNVTAVVPAKSSFPSEEDVSIYNDSGEQCTPNDFLTAGKRPDGSVMPSSPASSTLEHDVEAECIEVDECTKLPFTDDQETPTYSADRIATPEPPAYDLEHASTYQALLDRISELERIHEESKRKLGAAKRRYLKNEEKKRSAEVKD
ncbi:uncharacterized protein LOC142557869 [Dermacentor variabilis]|uniref:uncharacterized protein LOC142557869 n=1 Tax=Dermacentor variabilis TaxID=34621 RepID=UPI003F5BB830